MGNLSLAIFHSRSNNNSVEYNKPAFSQNVAQEWARGVRSTQLDLMSMNERHTWTRQTNDGYSVAVWNMSSWSSLVGQLCCVIASSNMSLGLLEGAATCQIVCDRRIRRGTRIKPP